MLNTEKETEIRFGLSPISEVLDSIPDGSSGNKKEIMLVVSDTVNPYYDQIFDYFTENDSFQKVKIKDLTEEMVNELEADGGYLIVAALDTKEEFNKFGATVKSSNFKKQVHIIECTQPDSQGVKDLQATVSDIQSSSSGVCINGVEYEGLNNLIRYETSAAVCTVLWEYWEKMDEAHVFTK
jgi:ABC-type phosphate transport system substrate-binding protein